MVVLLHNLYCKLPDRGSNGCPFSPYRSPKHKKSTLERFNFWQIRTMIFFDLKQDASWHSGSQRKGKLGWDSSTSAKHRVNTPDCPGGTMISSRFTIACKTWLTGKIKPVLALCGHCWLTIHASQLKSLHRRVLRDQQMYSRSYT